MCSIDRQRADGKEPVAAARRRAEVVADSILAIFNALCGEAIGPRSADILHAGLLALAGRPDATGRAFRRRCAKLGIRWQKLPPRSPNLNGFVERFQASVLHLHYGTAFRYRFYTSDADIDADLRAWLRYDNFERPHRGYRTRGRIPAAIFYQARPDLLTAKGWNPDDINPAA